MVNKEYIKSQIDTLPDEILIGVDKYINKKIKQKEEIDKLNAEYLHKIKLASKKIDEGISIDFTIEELNMMTEMPLDEAKKFAVKRAAENGVELCL